MRLYHRREIADTGSRCRRVQGCIAVRKGAEGAEGNRLTFGRRRKLNFIYREKRIVWVAFSRKWSLSPPLAQANLERGRTIPPPYPYFLRFGAPGTRIAFGGPAVSCGCGRSGA